MLATAKDLSAFCFSTRDIDAPLRLALFPLMLRIGRASAAHQAVMARLQPELDALKLKFKKDHRKLNTEIQRLLKRDAYLVRYLSWLNRKV